MKEKKTSIHFEPCKIHKSQIHNERKEELDYIFPELSHKNESIIYDQRPLAEIEKNIQKLYKEKVGQRMQSKTVPLREAVIVIDEDTQMRDLECFAVEMEELTGWKPLQIHIHRDEGYMKSGDNKGGYEVAKLNLHAHIVFDCQNKETGRMNKVSKQHFRDMQTLASKWTGLERGKPSNRKHLKSLEYKIEQKTKILNQLNSDLKEFEDLSVEMASNIEKLAKIEEKELYKAKEMLSKIEKKKQKRI